LRARRLFGSTSGTTPRMLWPLAIDSSMSGTPRIWPSKPASRVGPDA
jgi:hypothetical protein